LEKEKVYEMMNQAYMEAVFQLLPCMIGENKWERLGKDSQGDFDAMVTKTDEALLLWAIDCYWNVVAISDKLKFSGDGRSLDTPMYISEGNSTRKNRGWTEEGKTKYNDYYKMVCVDRTDKYWYGKIWKRNFKASWEAGYRQGKKSTIRMKPLPGAETVSMDDL
jgi:hypothetical protein